MNASWKDGLTPLPAKEFFEARLRYFPDSGELVWRLRPRSEFSTDSAWLNWNNRYSGTEAGCRQYRSDGKPNAIRISPWIDGAQIHLVAHRIIFVMMGIEVPLGMVIDHRDGNPFHNWWDNLRLAKHDQNLCNRGKPKRQRQDLQKGVSQNGDRYYARITHHGKKLRLGSYLTADDAKAAYDTASLQLHQDFAHP